MTHSDHTSDTIGHSVIALKEGAYLGSVAHVFFDTDLKKISGMTLKSKTFGKESWFGVGEVTLFGKDVVLLKGEASATPVGKGGVVQGKSLKDMRGMEVVTEDGKKLGTLDDLEVRREDLSICELYLGKGLHLAVEVDKIKIGKDQIMVPAVYSERVTDEHLENPGFLRRMLAAAKDQ